METSVNFQKIELVNKCFYKLLLLSVNELQKKLELYANFSRKIYPKFCLRKFHHFLKNTTFQDLDFYLFEQYIHKCLISKSKYSTHFYPIWPKYKCIVTYAKLSKPYSFDWR
jgi:hypothetical protein